jgi:uncharacterized protein
MGPQVQPSPEQQVRTPAGARPPPTVVLDTNAVMDWLVFQDPSCTAWGRRFSEGDARWLASAAMRQELDHVLSRGVARAWEPSLQDVWSAWDRYAIIVPAPPTGGPGPRIRCTDTDDQKFVDLALAHGVRWLVSRDRALLKLKRRLRPFGIEVLHPRDWSAAYGSG